MSDDIFDLFSTENPLPPKVTSTVQRDQFTEYAAKAFDYEFDGTIEFQPHRLPQDIPEDFAIGAIVGPSGSGKSLFLKHFGCGAVPESEWDPNKAIVSHFETPQDAVDRLSSVGLNSIPSWLKPFHVLSLGEAFRASLARNMGPNALFDEFTSVIDRTTAQSCSRSLKRTVDQNQWKGIVVATCHEDILPWLQPDWVFNTVTGSLTVGRWLHRPKLNMDVHRCSLDLWSSFAKHHYLTAEISKSAHCYVGLIDNKPCVFGSVLAFPHAVVQHGWRGHRTVVLPEYQGLGIGPRFSDAIAQVYVDKGGRYFSRTAHPRLAGYRDNSPKWKETSHSGKVRTDMHGKREDEDFYNAWYHDTERLCWAHEYIGDASIQPPS